MKLARLRRISQVVFLAIFLLLLMKTGFGLSWPVSIFLESDPFLALLNALASRALAAGMLWSLAILIPTFFLGRFFCGWICPLGTLNHFVSSLGWGRNRGRRRLESHRYQSWQRAKYYVLAATVAAAVFGTAAGGLLDPISLTVRSIGLAAGYSQGWFLGLLFLAVLTSNFLVTRFWCRALCPLGALLGLASRWSIAGLRKPAEICGQCNVCLMDCQGGDEPAPGAVWRKAECHLCMNCIAGCPDGSLHLGFGVQRETTLERPDFARRAAVLSLAGGAAAVPLLRAGVATSPRPVRPPGAREESAFLARCIRCGECMKVCPNRALHPAFAEAGVEGLWTPVVIPRAGYCEPSCVLCGQVCPTEAIRRFTLEEKGWVNDGRGAAIRIGMAFVDRGRCLPWAMERECIVCQEWCPTSPNAIRLSATAIRQPTVDPDRCVGCGACEYACPVKDRPAIYVTSAGESRSSASQFLLPPASGWARSGPARTFDSTNLWQYLDGGADKYVQAGVHLVTTTPYRFRNKSDAVADVYTLRSNQEARGLFEGESGAGSRPVPIGDAARLYAASLTFRQGRYFVRITAFEEGGDLAALARMIVRHLRGPGVE